MKKKTTYNLKKLILIGIIILSIFNSCKKDGTISNNNNLKKEETDEVAWAKQNVLKQLKEDGGIPEIFAINQRIPMRLVDMQGNSVNQSQLNLRTLSTCGGDLPDYADLKQYVRIFQCGSSSGYKIQWEFQLSWNNTVVLVNPYNSSNKTKGTVKIVNSSGVTQVNFTTYNVQIKSLGTDPANPSNTIFTVKFTCDNIISSYLIDPSGVGGPYTVRLGETFASNCSSLENYAVAPGDPAGYGFTPGSSSDPCNRIEKVYVGFPSGTSKLEVSGFDLVGGGCYNSTFIAPSLAEIYYSLDGGVTWKLDFSNNTAPNTWGVYHKRYLGFADVGSIVIAHGTYNIVVRYKNWKYNSSQPTFPIPTTSNACRTYSNDLTNSYAYEYFPNTVIP